MEIKKIGFIGTGVMGAPMVEHLLQAGFALKVYTRTKARALPLIEKGAVWCDSPRECAQDCDVVISIVGYPQDVQHVWMDRWDGALCGMKQGAIGVDMTTSSPELAAELYEKAHSMHLHMADCPVTGGDIGARNATLTMLFGGDYDVFTDLSPVFAALGKKAVYFGAAGKGQLAKACNQVAVAATMFSVCEALVFAVNMGLDPKLTLETLGGGAAGSFSMQSYGPRLLKEDYEPGFKVAHFLKDIEIALKVCQDRGISLPSLDIAHKAYQMLVDLGKGDLGTQALYLCYSSALLSDPADADAVDFAGTNMVETLTPKEAVAANAPSSDQERVMIFDKH